MSKMPGGPAAKLSARYEDWWTCLRVADLLEGAAARMRLEPPGDAGEGAEFWVEEPDGRRWYEQVKDTARSWTVNRLITEGVLSKVEGHLASGHLVRLVLSTDASRPRELTERARKTKSLTEFRDNLTEELRDDFQRTVRAWGAEDRLWEQQRPRVDADGRSTGPAEFGPRLRTWDYLRRIHIEREPPESLRRLVRARYQRRVQGDPRAVVASLRSWFDEIIQHEFTKNDVWAHLEGAGFGRQPLAGDPKTVDALDATVHRIRRRVGRRRPAFGLADSPHVEQLVGELVDGGAQVVVVDGVAGVGKSTVVEAAVHRLMADGWHAAAISMDRVPGNAGTARALGRGHDLEGSPLVLLGRVAAGSRAVLVIDQLDAVSHYSGRMPDAFEGVEEILDQARATPNVKVVLVVRTVDLERDPRLFSRLSDDGVHRIQLGPLGADDVVAVLEGAGIDTGALSDATRELLRIPLHLAVFGRLSAEARKEAYRTLPEMYAALTREVRLKVDDEVGPVDWDATCGRLVWHMSDNETLTAPRALLDGAPPRHVHALVSEGLLVEDRERIAFFHESYFDYLFAQSFTAVGGDLRDFLVESGQYLFRRAQTRQVLQHLAGTDREEFRRTTVRLLTDRRVRPHLHDVVAGVLAQIDPDPDDWRALEPIAFGEEPAADRLTRLLRLPAWFDAADQDGRWETWLADPESLDRAFHELTLAARERPGRVDQLVRAHVGASEAWDRRLAALIQWSLTPRLVDLAVELLDDGHLDGVRGPIAANSDFWSIIRRVVDDDPAGAARLIGAYLRRQLARAREDGSDDPFDSEHLPDRSPSAGAVINRAATGAPAAFLDEVLPFIVDVADRTADGRGGGLRRGRWSFRYAGEVHTVPEALLDGADKALRVAGAADPKDAIACAEELGRTGIEELHFLACRALAAADAPNCAVEWLLSSDANLELGWANSTRWATRELIERASAGCDDDRLARLVGRLMHHAPEWERRVDRRALRLRGRSEYDLLSAVDPARRSPDVKRRLRELERKFPDSPPSPPKPIELHAVSSPIDPDSASRMSDEQWLNAIRKHASDQTRLDGTAPLGGPQELARVLGGRAAAEPDRFSRLALRFGEQTPNAHLSAVISNVAGRVDIPLLGRLCVHARDVGGSDVGLTICRAVGQVADEADDTLVGLVAHYARDPDPREEEARKGDPDNRPFNGDLATAGLNCVRGVAAEAAAKVLFRTEAHVDSLVPVVTALANDPILAVRTLAADAVVALLNHRPGDALDLAHDLFSGVAVDVHDSPYARRLLIYALLRNPGRFTPHLSRALNAQGSVAENAGQVWAVASINGAIADPIPTAAAALSDEARRGAAAVFANNPASAPAELAALLDDPDPAVREAAAAAVTRLDSLDAPQASQLLGAVAASRAFPDTWDHLFRALSRARYRLPESTIEACERAVDEAGRDLGDIRTRHAATSSDLITVVLRLYRQGDERLRERCLDLIDELSKLGAYGLDEALDDER